jgi:manganese transport protein
LVISQVVLSLVLPVPMVALLIFVCRRDLMGTFSPGPMTRAAALVGTVVVLGLNMVLLAQLVGV